MNTPLESLQIHSNDKITKINIPYPIGQEPDFINPEFFKPYRFVLGKKGRNMLVALCMNPSKAQDATSDRTVNTVIKRSVIGGFDGWAVINIYPERATDKKNMNPFDEVLSNQNIEAIREFLRAYQITEVWGAWGNPETEQLKKGRDGVLQMMKEEGISIYGFNPLRSGDPHHPLYLNYDKATKFHCIL